MHDAMTTTFPQVEVRGRAALRRWLEKHHASSGPIWLVTFKKGEGPYLDYAAIVEEALCFGWIDSLPRTLDASRSMRLLSPRKPKSPWSKLNKERVASLIARGLMREPGLAAVERAKADGSWGAYDAVEALTLPDDLRRALASDGAAKANFDAFPPSSKKAILWWIASAKSEETRDKRIAETVAKAAQNLRANQYRQPKTR